MIHVFATPIVMSTGDFNMGTRIMTHVRERHLIKNVLMGPKLPKYLVVVMIIICTACTCSFYSYFVRCTSKWHNDTIKYGDRILVLNMCGCVSTYLKCFEIPEC